MIVAWTLSISNPQTATTDDVHSLAYDAVAQLGDNLRPLRLKRFPDEMQRMLNVIKDSNRG